MPSKRFPWLPGFLLISLAWASPGAGPFSPEAEWFCPNSEAVVPCSVKEASIDYFNNYKVYGLIQRLLQTDFFKFYKVRVTFFI